MASSASKCVVRGGLLTRHGRPVTDRVHPAYRVAESRPINRVEVVYSSLPSGLAGADFVVGGSANQQISPTI
jgi:hypothetical protein